MARDPDEYSVMIGFAALEPEPPPAPAPPARPSIRGLVDAAFDVWMDADVALPVPPAAVAPRTPTPLHRRWPKATPAPRFAPASPTADLVPGWDEPTQDTTPADVIDGKYKLEATLGSGGMGIVYAASHLQLGSTVAIKKLRPEAAMNPELGRRFLREARAASRLRSEHVCRALDVGTLPTGEPFMVMELLHGQDLAMLTREGGPLAVGDAARYVLQACEAVAEAHALGMIHRDLKPANLMLTSRGDGSPLVKVLDFGIATAATGDADGDGNLTRANVAMGSPPYMSPEQLRCAKAVDARSDIWSLGVTLYELVSGRSPFPTDTMSGLADAIAHREPRPLADVPAGFAAVVLRCLRKQPSERFATIADLAAALAPWAVDGAAGAARVARATHAACPPTLMSDDDDLAIARAAAARVAPTVDPSRNHARAFHVRDMHALVGGGREAPALLHATALPAAPVFLRAERAPVAGTIDAARGRRRSALPKIALVAVALAALGVAACATMAARGSSAVPTAEAAR